MINLTSRLSFFLFFISSIGLPANQRVKSPVPHIAQVEEIPAPATPLPGTAVPEAPGQTPTGTLAVPITPDLTPPAPITSSLTATMQPALTVSTTLTGTPEGEIEAGGAITVTETVGPASVGTVTPTPFRYIRVEPREVARSLLEKVLASILIFGGGLLVAAVARFLVHRLAERIHRDIRVFLGRLVYIAILVGSILWILRIFEVDVATITAIVGTVGLALSLSSQELFKNFIAGIYLLWERPFSIGDTVKIEDYTGRVEFVDLRTTRLRTEDGKQVILPNTLLMSQVVVRQPKEGWRVETRESPEQSLEEEEREIPGYERGRLRD